VRRFADDVDFLASFNARSLGRWPNGAGTGSLISMTANTLGAANSGPRLGPVRIGEVRCHPSSTSENQIEFVEIHNSGAVTENLAEWRLRGGVTFDFTFAHSLAPGGVLVVVAFDPVRDPEAAVAFRRVSGVDAKVPLVGPFVVNACGGGAGILRLQRPDTPPSGEPDFYPQVTEDEVTYKSASP
jgi:hypothetical protein